MIAAEKEPSCSPTRPSSANSNDRNSPIEDSIVEAAARYFAPDICELSTPQYAHRRFAERLAGAHSNLCRVPTDAEDLKRFAAVQVN